MSHAPASAACANERGRDLQGAVQDPEIEPAALWARERGPRLAPEHTRSPGLSRDPGFYLEGGLDLNTTDSFVYLVKIGVVSQAEAPGCMVVADHPGTRRKGRGVMPKQRTPPLLPLILRTPNAVVKILPESGLTALCVCATVQHMEGATPYAGTPNDYAVAKPRYTNASGQMSATGKDIRLIPVDQVRIHYVGYVVDGHRGYQRALSNGKIDKMVDTFAEEELTAIVVSQRSDGTYWVLDGQHRIETLRRIGRSMVLADVRHGLSIADEARMFVRLNAGPTRVGAWEQFQARLSYDPVAQEIDATIRRYGYHLDRSGNSPTGIAAVKALETIYERGMLDEVFSIISQVWQGDIHAVDAPVMEGLGIFLHSYGNQPAFTKERLMDVLKVTSATEVVQRQHRLVIEIGYGSARPAVMVAMALRDIFNGKRRYARKLVGTPVSASGKAIGYSAKGGRRPHRRRAPRLQPESDLTDDLLVEEPATEEEV